MSDRLKDLQRQRTLAQEQLDWLDREIARETGQTPAAARPPAAAKAPSSAEAARLAEEIISRYKNEAAAAPTDVKKGCFLYFGLAFGLLVLGLTALYFYTKSRQ